MRATRCAAHDQFVRRIALAMIETRSMVCLGCLIQWTDSDVMATFPFFATQRAQAFDTQFVFLQVCRGGRKVHLIGAVDQTIRRDSSARG